MLSKFPHVQPWRLDATKTLQYLPWLRLTGCSMAYMPRRSLNPPRRLWCEFLRRNSMVYSRSNEKFANLRCLIFTLLLLTQVISSRALTD